MLLRASGTEPLVRVMVEAEDEAAAHAAAERLCAVVRACAPAVVRPDTGSTSAAWARDGAVA